MIDTVEDAVKKWDPIVFGIQGSKVSISLAALLEEIEGKIMSDIKDSMSVILLKHTLSNTTKLDLLEDISEFYSNL